MRMGNSGRESPQFQDQVQVQVELEQARSASLELPWALCSNDIVKSGRILALDYGRRRVGAAVCDEMGIAVRPIPALPNEGRSGIVPLIRKLVEQHEIRRLVVGLPVNMDGTTGDSADQARKFMQVLQSELKLPLTEVDERLTTVEAEALWREMSPRQQKRYRSVDSLAAALILQRFLEEQ
jgi:putative Holliday junction resolvase